MRFVLVDPNANETADAVKKYLAQSKMDLPFYRLTDAAFRDWLDVPSTPFFVLIDDQGRLRYAGALEVGEFGGDNYHAHLMNAIADVQAGRPVEVRYFATTG